MNASAEKMRVDKTVPRRAALCVTCEHEKCADDIWPCNCCWNPLGDMYRRRVHIQIEPMAPPKLKVCPLCGSDQVQLCTDANNTAKDQCKCRQCGCTAPRAAWNKDRAAAQEPEAR